VADSIFILIMAIAYGGTNQARAVIVRLRFEKTATQQNGDDKGCTDFKLLNLMEIAYHSTFGDTVCTLREEQNQ
jgi:hypothetical protein